MYHPIQPPEGSIDWMKEMVKKNEGRELTDQEAHEAAYNYLNFFNILLYLDKKQKQQTIMNKMEGDSEDEFYPRAKELALQDKTITQERLQKILSVGYPRSVRLMQMLAQEGIIDAKKGSQDSLPREASDVELLDEIRAIFAKEGECSLTELQRRLLVGYSRLERLVKEL